MKDLNLPVQSRLTQFPTELHISSTRQGLSEEKPNSWICYDFNLRRLKPTSYESCPPIVLTVRCHPLQNCTICIMNSVHVHRSHGVLANGVKNSVSTAVLQRNLYDNRPVIVFTRSRDPVVGSEYITNPRFKHWYTGLESKTQPVM